MGLTKPRAAQIFNLDYKQATRVVTTAAVTVAGGAPSSVDGVSLTTGDRVLVTAQVTGSQNGLYYVVTVGSGSNGTWARTSDGNDNGEIEAGMIVMVTEGVIYADTQWKLITDDPITIGTTSLSFTQNYSANSITGGTSNVRVFSNANVTISSAGTANVLTVTSTGTVTTGTASVTGNITGGNIAASTANISTFLGNVFFGSVPAQPTWYTIAPLNLNNSLAAATKVQLNLINTGGGAGAGSAIDFYTYQISVAAANAESRIAAIDDGNYSAYLSLQTKTPGSTGTNTLVERVKIDSTGVSVVANITGGNILTGGTMSSTGNVTGGNVLTGGLISAAGNITGGNVSATSHTGTSVSVTANVTGGNIITGGLVSVTGNITGGNISATNHTGTNVSVTGTITAASTVGGVITGSSSSVTGTQTAASTVGGVITGSSASVTGTVTAASTVGGVITGSTASLSGNVTGGNILTVGTASVTGTITTAAGTNSTGFAVGNGAVSNVGLGFFPTAGSRGDYAIRDYSTVFTTMYLDAGMGGSAGGEFQFRSSNAFSLLMRANSSGVYTPGIVSATGRVYGLELNSTQSSGDEGGQINLALAATNTTLSGSVIVDVFQNKIRFYEGGGNNRGAYIDLSQAGNAVSTNLLAGGGGGTPGGANTNVQFNDGGLFGGNGQFVYNKVTNTLTVGNVAANANGQGTNFLVGDDGYVGDINVADTIGIKGQQNGANGYIVFGNADSTSKLGRAGSGPLTYAGSFSATGTVTGASVVGGVMTGSSVSVTGAVSGASAAFSGASTAGSYSATGTVTGGNIVTAGQLTVNSGANVTAIVNGATTGVGNIGSSTVGFNTVFAKATTAQYADLAEMYVADTAYTPGTVVEFGGSHEITITNTTHSTQVAGIISTQPAYLMNSTQTGEHPLEVALVGRVPCSVVGTVRKGDRLVSSTTPGVAQALDINLYQPGCIVGKALEEYDSAEPGVIEVAVGRS